MKKLIYIFLIFSSISFYACEDLLDESPKTFLSSETTHDTDIGLAAGAVGLYDEMSYSYSSRLPSIYGLQHYGMDLSMMGHNPQSNDALCLYNADFNSEFDAFEDAWNHYYRLVNKATTIIDRSKIHEWVDKDLEKTVNGEAYFYRAYGHFMLVSLWGGIPLITEEIKGVKLDFVRDSEEDAYDLIIEDLKQASINLPVIGKQDGRLTKGAAQHLLAYASLGCGKWEQAEIYADSVIAGPYELMKDRYGKEADNPEGNVFSDLFEMGSFNYSEGNTEGIWVLQFEDMTLFPNTVCSVNDFGVNYTRRFWVSPYWRVKVIAISEEYGGRGFNMCQATDYFLNLFELSDIRGQEAALRRTWKYNDSSLLPEGAALGDTVPVLHEKWMRPHVTKFDYYNEGDPALSSSYKDVYMFRLSET